jgi:hypothetical protein
MLQSVVRHDVLLFDVNRKRSNPLSISLIELQFFGVAARFISGRQILRPRMDTTCYFRKQNPLSPKMMKELAS